VRPESSTIRFNHAVGFFTDNVSLNCCEGSENKKNQDSLHLCRLFAIRIETDCVAKFAQFILETFVESYLDIKLASRGINQAKNLVLIQILC
jgi:hypothetical protein